MSRYMAVVKEFDGCWIGWIEELPDVNCQATCEELLASLCDTLREVLELNRADAREGADSGYEEFQIAA